MVGERLVHHQQLPLAGWVSLIGTSGWNGKFRDNRLELGADRSRVVHEESAVCAEAGMKRHPQKSRFAPRRDDWRNVKKRGHNHRAVLNDSNGAALLDDEDSIRAVARRFESKGQGQS